MVSNECLGCSTNYSHSGLLRFECPPVPWELLELFSLYLSNSSSLTALYHFAQYLSNLVFSQWLKWSSMQISGTMCPYNTIFPGTLPHKFQPYYNPHIIISLFNSERPLCSAWDPPPCAESKKHCQAESQGDHRAHLICILSFRPHSSTLPVAQSLKTVVLYLLSGFPVVYSWKTTLLPIPSSWPESEEVHPDNLRKKDVK